MKGKIDFNKYLKDLTEEILNEGKEEQYIEEAVNLDGEEYDIDSLFKEVEDMKKSLEETSLFMFEAKDVIDESNLITEMHDSKLDVDGDEEEEDDIKLDKNYYDRIRERMYIYNEGKKQSFQNETEQDTFRRIMEYKVPADSKRLDEKIQRDNNVESSDQLVVLIDTEEALLVKSESFDFSRLDESKRVHAADAGHPLEVFDKSFDYWYEYDSKDFDNLV